MRDARDRGTPRVLAITACPTGIAHTYMAAENLEAAAHEMGIELRVETHGSVGVEGAFSAEEIANADAILISADTVIDKQRFAGKRLLSTSVDAAIKDPAAVLKRAQSAPVWTAGGAQDDSTDTASSDEPLRRQLYQALMNGVSHMVPFVVTGGLLIAVSLSLGGEPSPEGLAIPEDSFWFMLSSIGALAFGLMVPVLSAYIASGIAGRPGLAPGFITGMIAVTGSLYNSDAGAGFIGGIITGFLSGYVALAVKKIPVGKYGAAIMPVIVIPIATTLIVGLLFVYVLGGPISSLFAALTTWLASLEGASVIVLGAILGAMIAFDMGGPFNKTAFLFGGGMIASGNAAPMGMVAAAIAVPPLAVGLATLLRRSWFNNAERDSGIAALFMGFFGITEGAIPVAAARPLQVIPANVAGGAVAGAVAGLLHVEDNVMHGGPIVAILGAVDNTLGFFIALAAGIAVTTGLIIVLVGISRRQQQDTSPAAETAAPAEHTTAAPAPATAGVSAAGAATAGAGTAAAAATEDAAGASPEAAETTTDTASEAGELITASLVALDTLAPDSSQEEVLRTLVHAASEQDRITHPEQVIDAARSREAHASTAVGHHVAIPHARCSAVARPTLAFARIPEPGMQWDEDAEDRVRMVFFIAAPEDAGTEHLRILSKLARATMREDIRAQLLQATTAEEAVAVIRSCMH
ncbi:fructose-specific PTS transporter subunit EIIC [Corynebacterium sp. TAE3-ERU30]|uniref:fructose-specific PTS transporter subunit EIIC n=1 Tax=Corynebacterium sp. TAE3-ERU30 TaxID=2849496 RepID=UPI001C4764C4|nr:fructose-specific PTS transporter subunit EIIC [Corynebacterium sp. TAE3-ERU30]MBV7281353.1 fructose-specific PTS transporter subunit EIIC [Corynebacterium sp. TAE3-ERU30]